MTKTGRILLIILAAAGACRPAQAQEFRVKPDHTVVFGGQHLLPDYLRNSRSSFRQRIRS